MSDIVAIKQGLAQRAEDVAEMLLPRGRKQGNEWRCGSLQGEPGQSLGVHLTGHKAGLWSDFATGEAGDLIDLWQHTTGLKFVEVLDRAREYLGMERPKENRDPNAPRKTYKRPQKPECHAPKEKALDYLHEVRNVSVEAIAAYEVAEKDNGDILFPFLSPEGELVMATSRAPRDGAPCIPISKDFEHILGGWHAIPDDTRVIDLTEGYIDALSMYDYGYPALTVPMGGGGGRKQQWIDNEYERMERFEKVYLALDDDKVGEEAAVEIARRLGRHRCLRVRLPKKDANECLMQGVAREEIAAAIDSAESLERINSEPAGPTLICRCASEIESEHIEWLWPGRIAVGKQTCIAGDPGTGKSQLSVAIAAAISSGGEWPCGEGRAPLGNIIIFSAEDGASDTIIPRLIAAGADLNRIHIVDAVGTEAGSRRGFNLQADLKLLEEKIAEIGDVCLIVIDPISSYLGKTDSHKNAEVRGVLEPIAEMAERTRVAVCSVTHFSKPSGGTGTKALHKFIGSIAFVAAARAAFAVLEDPDDTGRRLFLHAKNNLSEAPQGLAFHLERSIVGEGIITSRVKWEYEPVAMTANEALAAETGKSTLAVEEAECFLQALLADGPVPSKQVGAEAQEAGVAKATLRRAKASLGITSYKDGMDGGWFCALPKALKSTEGAQIKNVSIFGIDEHLRASTPPMEVPSNGGRAA